MFSCLSGQKQQSKPFKVRNLDGTKRYGIAAKSLSELRAKVRQKFELDKKTTPSLVLEEDGTDIDEDEYLMMLPYNCLLVLLRDDENWTGIDSLMERALTDLFRATHLPAAAQQIREAMSSEDSPLRLDILGKMTASLAMDVVAEDRPDDKAWFNDLPAKFKTKTSFMREKARVRVRGYLYHTKDYITKQTVRGRAKKKLQGVLNNFIVELKQNDYFSQYFARGHADAICEPGGWFRCEGAFDVSDCRYVDHRINPYGSRDFRILFSTWDLDHRIEKSREVLPCLTEAANHKTKQINTDYFFKLLFTRNNLKLVHPVCHDKSGHTSAKCDPDKICK